jgi:hypothetical protein
MLRSEGSGKGIDPQKEQEDSMTTPRKRTKPQTILAPKEVKGKEADRVKGGMDLLSKLIQMKNDMQKGIIANFRV